MKSRGHFGVTASFVSRYQFIEQVAAAEPVLVLGRVLEGSAAFTRLPSALPIQSQQVPLPMLVF
jgi:hypothetical protein